MNVKIMDMVLEAKFSQHGQLYNLLLDTEDRELIEASPVRQMQINKSACQTLTDYGAD